MESIAERIGKLIDGKSENTIKDIFKDAKLIWKKGNKKKEVSEMKLYRLIIQDGENVYHEYTIIKPTADYVDGFERAVKNITTFSITKKELDVLRKFKVI